MELDFEGLLDMIETLGEIDTPVQREMFLKNQNKVNGVMDMEYGGGGSYKDLGVMSTQEIGQYPDVGWTNMDDSFAVTQFLNNMPHADRVQVEAMRQRVTKDQFDDLMRQLMDGQVGSGVLHDPLPIPEPIPDTSFFQTDETGKTLNPKHGSNYYAGTMMQDTGFYPKYLEEETGFRKYNTGDKLQNLGFTGAY